VPFDQPLKGGMVDFDANGCVSVVIDKPQQSTLRYSWFTAAWTPSFTEFLHQYLVNQPFVSEEVLLNVAIQAAIDSGLKVEVEVFESGSFLDIGTPEDLVRAVRNGEMEVEKITAIDADS
jgi:glucose-1-phosphate thymidylyltransferase